MFLIDCFCLDCSRDCCQSTLRLDRRIQRLSVRVCMECAAILLALDHRLLWVYKHCLDRYPTPSPSSSPSPYAITFHFVLSNQAEGLHIQPTSRGDTHPQLSSKLTKCKHNLFTHYWDKQCSPSNRTGVSIPSLGLSD